MNRGLALTTILALTLLGACDDQKPSRAYLGSTFAADRDGSADGDGGGLDGPAYQPGPRACVSGGRWICADGGTDGR
jgi:hypothetical protein